MTTTESRGELKVAPRGHPPSDPLHRDSEALGRGTAVDNDDIQGVLPERGLPPACIAQQVEPQAAAHASGGVKSVLALAVLDAAPERLLREELPVLAVTALNLACTCSTEVRPLPSSGVSKQGADRDPWRDQSHGGPRRPNAAA